MTGRADNVAALIEAVERGAERGVVAALDRHLPRLADHLADAVADRVLDRLDRRRRVERLIRKRIDMGYPARDAAAWIEANYDKPPTGGDDPEECKRNNRARINLWRWRTGQQERATRRAIEETIRTCGGDPADLPDELPAPESAGTEGAGDG